LGANLKFIDALHALSFNYTVEEIDEGSKSSQVLFPGLAHARPSREPWIECQEFPATICVDAEIILPKWLTF
jgi:hypothetical protein